ncbi:tRNA pseudouridine(55) synthase TruB [Peptoniphilus vaginalis]|uniref:tRNA pseudouridine(55) synthase TruB n=1 Tax=Peptoniphilus vaginalis TaxID=1756987 RepID=UPI0023F851A2|nr:tRNA pseudouridine(55) synthase TruB [Peptoniphilus vaginalis]
MIDGLLIFDKEKGITSHDLVYKVRRKLGIKKVGHTGTLDPMATGVLVISIGKATKTSDYIISSDKEYEARVKLGVLTDTYDITGEILKEERVTFTIDEITNALKHFTGKMAQKPPIYSALKVKGKKLYEYAREGKDVEIKKRDIEIYNNDLLDFNGSDEFLIRVKVSKGTYIRSLANDIGEFLGTYGTLTELRRTRTGDFKIEDSITTSSFQEMSIDKIKEKILPMDRALSNFKKIEIDKNFCQKFLNGQFYKLNNKLEYEDYRVYCDNLFLGIGEVKFIDNKAYLKMKKKLIGDL